MSDAILILNAGSSSLKFTTSHLLTAPNASEPGPDIGNDAYESSEVTATTIRIGQPGG